VLKPAGVVEKNCRISVHQEVEEETVAPHGCNVWSARILGPDFLKLGTFSRPWALDCAVLASQPFGGAALVSDPQNKGVVFIAE